MSNDPSSNKAQGATVTTFLTALVTNAAVFAVEIILFSILRPKFKAVYQPRSYIPPDGKRVKPMSSSLLKWPIEIFKLDHDDIRRQNGLDAYVFVRFLRMMAMILFPIWIISWGVLLPVNGIRKPTGATGLDRFTFGNVAPKDWPRYWAHLGLAYLFTFWILYVIRREMRHFITVRQRYLVDPAHAASAQAATILITGVPPRYLHPSALKRLFKPMPGGVKTVWINRDLKDIPDLFDERLAALNKLESAETKLMNIATSLDKKNNKKMAKGKQVKPIDVEQNQNRPRVPGGKHEHDAENPRDAEIGEPTTAERLVPLKQRPTHRLKPSFLPFGLPFTGKKVDTIDWCKEEIPRLNREIASRQKACLSEMGISANVEHGTDPVAPLPTSDGVNVTTEESYPRLNSAFVQFNSQLGAMLASQSLSHHEPYRMAQKFTDVAPEDVIWSNLNMNPYESKLRKVISYAATSALIIFWAIPVAFVGAVSNIEKLSNDYAWLHWLGKIPKVILGILQGVLPPVLLAVLMLLLPIVLRMLAKFEGIPRRTSVELSLMTRYYIFQVVHSFLIVSLASGIVPIIKQATNNPASIPTLLTQNLPNASIFFLTYILLQAAAVAGGFLQIATLVVYYVKLFLLGSTPRSIYKLKNGMRSVQWGTLFPSVTLLVTITLAYSVLQPIMNGLAFALFFLMYMLYKYLFLYQFDQPEAAETGGLFFPKAITQIFIGLYVEEVCLAALFFLARKPDNKASAIPEGALMIVLLLITAGYHYILLDSFGPLLNALPLSLVERANQDPNGFTQDDQVPPLPEKNGHTNGHSKNENGNGRLPQTSEYYGVNGANGRSPKSSTEIDVNGSRTRDSHPYANINANGTGNKPHVPLNGTGDSDDSGVEKQDFTHPALSPARVVWLPRDTMGIEREEVGDLRARGIEVSSEGAFMNEKGTVDVDSPPPGEEPAGA